MCNDTLTWAVVAMFPFAYKIKVRGKQAHVNYLQDMLVIIMIAHSSANIFSQ